MNELQNEHKAIKSSFGLFDGQTITEYVKNYLVLINYLVILNR